MGYLRPTAIIVGAAYHSDGEAGYMKGLHWTEVAHAKATEIFTSHDLGQLVSPIVEGITNGERSFYVAWDGSKEGWEPSDRGDDARAQFVAWLREQGYGDGSSPLDWVELQYGGDDREVIALAHDGEQAIA